MIWAIRDIAGEIFPAPPLNGEGIVTAKFITELLADPELSPARAAVAHFALGNIHLRERRLKQAVAQYLAGLKIFELLLKDKVSNGSKPEPVELSGFHRSCSEVAAELRTNLALAHLVAKDFKSAAFHAKRALLAAPQLLLAHLVVGRAAIAQAKPELAVQAYQKAHSCNPANTEALSFLAKHYEEHRNVERACTYYELLLLQAPEDTQAQNALTYIDFKRAKSWFTRGRLPEAFMVWGKSYRRFPKAFHTNRRLVREMNQLVREYHDKGRFAAAVERYRAHYTANPGDHSPLYDFVSQYLFATGLYPEAWEDSVTLENEVRRWRSSLDELGDHPYPHFRLALCFLYRGGWDDALLELSICHDKFPPKKHSALKLRELFALVKLMQDIESRREEYLNVLRPEDEWLAAGFKTMFLARPWQKSGLSPTEAFAWRSNNFKPRAATLWRKAGFSPEEAALWCGAGFDDPAAAKVWARSEFSPEEALRWQEHCPLELDAVIQHRRAGFEDPAVAYRWSQVFLFPFESVKWHELGFAPAEATEWRNSGFRQPLHAAQWRAAGHSPGSAVATLLGEQHLAK